MESFCAKAIQHQTPKPLLFSRPSPSPLKPSLPTSISLSRKPTTISIRAAASQTPSTKTPHPLSSLLKPASITLTAAAALLLATFHKPSLAHAAVAPASESENLPSEESKSPLTEEEKERILEEYLDVQPDDVRSLRALMELKIKADRFNEAIDIIDRILLLEPEDKDLPLLKAHLLSHSGDIEASRMAFEELLQKDPFLVEAYHGLVMVAYKLESADGAAELDNIEMRVELDGIVKRVEAAMEACKKEKRKEDLRDFKLLLAQIRVVEGKFDEALRVYEGLVKEEPRDFRPYLCQGIIYSLLRKKDEAKKQFEKYRRLVPRGHPYARYFDENVLAMKVFGQMEENKKASSLNR